MVEIFQNIREIYDFKQPCEELSAYIEFFSETSAGKSEQYFARGHASVKMFQSWTPTFYINLSGPYLIELGQRRFAISSAEDILILRNSEVIRYNLPTDSIFTVKFYPGGLEAILGINQVNLNDKVINLNKILPSSLLVQIKQPLTFDERTMLMESFLTSELRKQKTTDHYIKMVRDCIGEYNLSEMQLNTSQVAEKLFISSKTINRYFNRVVGLAPKSYFSILRARTAMTSLVNDREHFNPLNHGYYDHAHFYKDVVKFTKQKLSLQF